MTVSDLIAPQSLWTHLFQASTVQEYFSVIGEQTNLISLQEYLRAACIARKKSPGQVIACSGIDRSFGHHIFRGTRSPSRDTVLKLAYGLELNVEQTQQLLEAARMATLHPGVKRDAVIAHGIHTGRNLVQLQQILFELGFPLLGGG